jgi:hypothetical protein
VQYHSGTFDTHHLPGHCAGQQLFRGFKRCSIPCRQLTKTPCMNRIGYSMIKGAEEAGKIQPGKTTLVEPTSGARIAYLNAMHACLHAVHSSSGRQPSSSEC